jgi:putative FmdB family regulatory protein
MPSYEYICSSCGEKKILIKSMRDTTTVPSCCNAEMLRVYFAPAIEFKGKGWASKE